MVTTEKHGFLFHGECILVAAFPKGAEDYRCKLHISAWVMYLLKEFPVSLQ